MDSVLLLMPYVSYKNMFLDALLSMSRFPIFISSFFGRRPCATMQPKSLLRKMPPTRSRAREIWSWRWPNGDPNMKGNGVNMCKPATIEWKKVCLWFMILILFFGTCANSQHGQAQWHCFFSWSDVVRCCKCFNISNILRLQDLQASRVSGDSKGSEGRGKKGFIESTTFEPQGSESLKGSKASNKMFKPVFAFCHTLHVCWWRTWNTY